MVAPRILLLMLEFPTWESARPWSYPAHFAIVEGLRRNGAATVVIPITAGIPSSSRRSWLHHIKQLCKPDFFDQVWVWLVHSTLDEEILTWVQAIAPIQVALIPESLDHTPEELELHPHLEQRRALAFQQLKGFTHALACDEKDVEDINSEGLAKAAWWTNTIPERFFIGSPSIPTFPQAAFYGSLYNDQRKSLLAHPCLRGVLANPLSSENGTNWPNLFNALQEGSGNSLERGFGNTCQDLSYYVASLQNIRNQTFQLWLKALEQWSAVVQLPTIVKCYSSRVIESMCVGRPCISWRVPNRPRNEALFQEGKDIIFFDPTCPESLLAQIQKIQRDPEFGRFIGCNAREKLQQFHTAEGRVQQILQWIQTGKEPDYGEQDKEGSQKVSSSTLEMDLKGFLVGRGDNGTQEMMRESQENAPSVAGNLPANIDSLGGTDTTSRTTVFIITIGDIAFRECHQAIQQQTAQPLVLDIIKDFHPMSAAFQEMFRRCETEYFIQVDEDMILEPTAVQEMELMMRRAPDNVGMMCFHLFDVDRDVKIQGVKIYRTSVMKSLVFRNVKACEMDLLEQMSQQGIRWILHPKIQGRHGTEYTPETIYRRYKSMYEKDILEWNDITEDIRRKANQFRETGSPLALFSLMGAVDGIVSAKYVEDQEKDFTKYDLKSLDVFRRVFLESHHFPLPYDSEQGVQPSSGNSPIPFEEIMWKSDVSPLFPELNSRSDNQSERQAEPRHTSVSNGKRILLACQFFWPSVGGVETVVANLGCELVNQGYQVDVATVALSNRTHSDYQGMNIISLDSSGKIGPRQMPYLCWELHQLLTSGNYDACVLFANPHNWFIQSLLLGNIASRTKLFIQLLVNKEGFDDWCHNQQICDRLTTILKNTDGALALTRHGVEVEFMKKRGISPVYLPNATTPIEPKMDFRETYGIPREAYLIVHVANIWKVKNHLGLIQTIRTIPDNWQMVLIGIPYDKGGLEETEYGEQVLEALKRRPEILYIPGLPREDIAAAMKAANVALLASHAEISPMAIVEAMSYGTPWLATPECGDVADKAGGIVAPLTSFPLLLTLLEKHSEFRLTLGKLGYVHWKSCYSWDVIIQGWIELLETGSLSKSYDMPQEVATQMNALAREFNTFLSTSVSLPCDQYSEKLQEHFTGPPPSPSLPISSALVT